MSCLSRIALSLAVVLGIKVGALTAAEPSPTVPRPLPQASSSDVPKLALPPLPTIEPNPPTGNEPLHDPTRPSPMMRQLIDPPKSQGKALELPVVELKARIVGGNQGSVAMLQIDKRLVVVRQGSEIALDGSHYGSQKLRVVELNVDEVRLELQPLNRILSLR